MAKIQFWNGNKSAIRGIYEPKILKACISATVEDFGEVEVETDNTNYPLAIDESNVFRNGTDVLVTVFGNPKFAQRDKIIVEQVIDKGLLGYRALLCRQDMQEQLLACRNIKDLRQYCIGIPATWADAELFRFNQFSVMENGQLEDLFPTLNNRDFDFTSLGINEVQAIMQAYSSPDDDIVILPELMLYYPMLLVFYVHPKKPKLAQRISTGLKHISDNGDVDKIFESIYGECIKELHIEERQMIELKNPDITGALCNYQSQLFLKN